LKNEQTNAVIEIQTKVQLSNDVLLNGEIELLMVILPELLKELLIITEPV
jgi:hypothetical protein